MAQYWDFTADSTSVIKTLRDSEPPREQTFIALSLRMVKNLIYMYEAGVYATAIAFEEIGTIGGVAPTDLQDAYDKILAIIPTSGGGTGIQSIVAGPNVTVDDTDPQNPVVSASGGSQNEQSVYDSGGQSYPYAVVVSDDGLTNSEHALTDDGGFWNRDYSDGGDLSTDITENTDGVDVLSSSVANDYQINLNSSGARPFYSKKKVSTDKKTSLDTIIPIANTTILNPAKRVDGGYIYATTEEPLLPYIQITDTANPPTILTDLTTSLTWLEFYTDITEVYDAVWVNGVLRFRCPANSDFSMKDGFLSGTNSEQDLRFEDKWALVSIFSSGSFKNNTQDNEFGSYANLSSSRTFSDTECFASSTGNNIIIGDTDFNEEAFRSAAGDNYIKGNITAGADFFANSMGNNIIYGDLSLMGTAGFSSSTGDNKITGNVTETGAFFLSSTGNNELSGTCELGNLAFKDAAPPKSNKIYYLKSCGSSFGENYTGRFDINKLGETSGADLPTDIFTTSNYAWLRTSYFNEHNNTGGTIDGDVLNAITNMTNLYSNTFYD